MLETLGRCPLAFFFEHVLRATRPRDGAPDETRWLPPPAAGTLLHQVFRHFHTVLSAERRPPEFAADSARLLEMLDLHLDRYRKQYPVPSTAVLATEVRQLRDAALLFLVEEEAYCRAHQPVFLDAAVGFPARDGGTPLDSATPVAIPLEDGSSLPVKGRLDRVDRAPGAENQFVVWDYKTGSPARYQKADSFSQGRHLQHAVYVAMAQARLTELYGPAAEVVRFGYFFPSRRGQGDRISWSAAELAEGRRLLAQLRRVATAGVFLASNDEDDCTYCAYRGCCNVPEVNEASDRKLADPANVVLETLREVRDVQAEARKR
jgi:ATP-dependent helicase/nuclease subunit B